MDSETKQQALSKIQTGDQFNKIFQDQPNTNCFQCGKKSKQWAQTRHAVFLCLNCAAVFRDVTKIVNVKSIGLDSWTKKEIQQLKVGGNKKFKEFLDKYQLYGTQPKVCLRSTASEYYRRSIQNEIQGKQKGEAPSIQLGKKPYVPDIPLSQMTSDQILQEAKFRLSYAGDKAKHYGSRAYQKVHHKITSGQLKEDAKKTAQKVGTAVSTTAKSFWSFVSTKIDEIKKKDEKKPAEETLQI